MARRRLDTMDVYEILRLVKLGQSNRAIAGAMKIDRKTVGKYRAWAEKLGLLASDLPSHEELHELLEASWPNQVPPQNTSTVAAYHDDVVGLRDQGVEMAAIHQRLVDDHHFTGSYSAVWRYVTALEPQTPDVVVRVEVKPGEEAQVDFGSAGRMIDPATGKLRRAWVFVMTLSWSRHQYVEFVFDQKVETWLLLHRHAFEFFGGVPERVVPDNLKAAIVKACWDDPQVQRAYRECAEHYGFLIAPCRVGTPEHKGKVEQGGVHYVKRNFLAGREPMRISDANQAGLKWVEKVAGQRRHGTTKQKPLVRFHEVEAAALQPLPATPYEPATWKQVNLYRDCYIVFEQAYYSAPYRLAGQALWVRGGARTVEIYTQDHKRVAIHDRARQPGDRITNLNHLPPEKLPGLLLTRPICREQAAAIGPATSEVVEGLLNHRPEDRLRTAGRLLKLAQRFTPERLEAACCRALHFDDPAYVTVKRILEQELDTQPLPELPSPAPAQTFVRSAQDFARALLGGGSWT
jgi:transposase